MLKYVFISGIPRAGKSYLANRVASRANIFHFSIDVLRDYLLRNPHIEPWVNFFWNKNETEYWANVTPQEHWDNLKKQSEAFWPILLEKIHEFQKIEIPAVFEGVNILPHLVHRDLDFSGIVLPGESEQAIFERCKKNPRWGMTEALQREEAKWYFVNEGTKLTEEADRYGYKVFYNIEDAEKELMTLLGK
jgi:hypothetical protein